MITAQLSDEDLMMTTQRSGGSVHLSPKDPWRETPGAWKTLTPFSIPNTFLIFICHVEHTLLPEICGRKFKL